MSVTLNEYLKVIDPYLAKQITEIAINKPGELWLEEGGEWVKYDDPKITMDWLEAFSSLVANKQQQEVSAKKPLLSTTLSSGLRIQIVKPPACVIGTFTSAIRKPGSVVLDDDYYKQTGFFDRIVEDDDALSDVDMELLKLKKERKYLEFLDLAIKAKKNIVVSGATSTGKTTFTNYLLSKIPPGERLITIEDAEELQLSQKNTVRLIYSKGGQGVAKVSPGDLLETCLRLTPDRIIYAEIRGGEAYDFLDTIFSGHDGCITSMHAASPMKAIYRLQMMIKKNEVGRSFDTKDIKNMVFAQVDVIVQIKRAALTQKEIDKGWSTRYISEIHFDPVLQQKYIKAAMEGDEEGGIAAKLLRSIVELLTDIKGLISNIWNALKGRWGLK